MFFWVLILSFLRHFLYCFIIFKTFSIYWVWSSFFSKHRERSGDWGYHCWTEHGWLLSDNSSDNTWANCFSYNMGSSWWETNNKLFYLSSRLDNVGVDSYSSKNDFHTSMDLHALYDYARTNPSLISIVLSPEQHTVPAFCLNKLGMRELGKCKKVGFHTHNTDNLRLYNEAEHVVDDQTCETIVVDFRIERQD